MATVVLVIHLILALAIIGLVLLQRSEGGGLGIGGGSGGLGSFASAGQTANALTRMTAFCALAFLCTSLTLAVLAGNNSNSGSLLENLDNPPAAVDTEAKKGDNELPDAQGTGSDSKNDSSPPSAPLAE